MSRAVVVWDRPGCRSLFLAGVALDRRDGASSPRVASCAWTTDGWRALDVSRRGSARNVELVDALRAALAACGEFSEPRPELVGMLTGGDRLSVVGLCVYEFDREPDAEVRTWLDQGGGLVEWPSSLPLPGRGA